LILKSIWSKAIARKKWSAVHVIRAISPSITRRRPSVSLLPPPSQHLIVLLDPADIIVNMHSAYARPEFRECLYAVFHSGPSATAAVEGVLILRAQGARSSSVLLGQGIPTSLIERKVVNGAKRYFELWP